jgi:hypothetical protein
VDVVGVPLSPGVDDLRADGVELTPERLDLTDAAANA